MSKLLSVLQALVLVACVLFVQSCHKESVENPAGEAGDSVQISKNSGLIYVTAKDYTPDVSMLMLQDDEPESVMFNKAERSFRVNAPLQVSINEKQELFLRYYCPRKISNVTIWMRITGYDEQFKLAFFEEIPGFTEFHKELPFVKADKRYLTRSGKEIEIVANPHLSSADLEIEVECIDGLYQRMIGVDCKYMIYFSGYSGEGSWASHLKPAHAREACAIALNMACMYASDEFAEELEKYRGRLHKDANKTVIDIDVLRRQAINHSGLRFGHVSGVNGLGGGETFGLAEWCYLEHYADDTGETHTIFHEFGHCLGYGHDGNMTYENTGTGWITLCQTVYHKMCREKKLPVYSRRFMHTRKDKNRYDKTNLYVASKYIIEDPELDALDGGLSPQLPESDEDFEKGTALSCKISYSDIPGATTETFTPKDVCVADNRIYVVNDAAGHFSVEVLEENGGKIQHVKSIQKWNYNGKEETFLNTPTGITVSHNKLYVTNAGSRTDVFDTKDFSFVTCIGNGSWGEGNVQTVHAFDVAVARGCVFIKDKRKVCVFMENEVTAGNYQKVVCYTRTENMGEDMGTYSLAIHKDGLVYATHQSGKKIWVFDINAMRERQELKASRTLTLTTQVYGICLINGRPFVTLNQKDRLVEINTENGSVVRNFTAIGGRDLSGAEKITYARQTLFVVDRTSKTITGIPVGELN